MTLASFVTLCQPMARTHSAYSTVHDYTQGPSMLHPCDNNWEAPSDQDDGGSAVVLELGNLPPKSTIRAATYVSNRTPCSQFRPGDARYNGERLIVDIWVAPCIAGVVRPERYLGYGVYQHLTAPVTAELRLTAGDDGLVTALVGLVYGDSSSPNVEGCWFGTHVHQVASRDIELERSDGSYTTGTAEKFSSGTQRGLGRGSEIYRFLVDWDR